MMRNFGISVAMATYNGEKYIKEQLNSILVQLENNDEIIISDDGSKDKTLDIVKSFNDKRIKIFNGPKKGVKQNFANALSKCNGKYIFLADQDDLWMPTKVETVISYFEKNNCSCVIHDAEVFDSNTNEIIINSFFDFRNSKNGVIKNIIKNSYIGCCMAIEKEALCDVLPIPNDIEMHDQWIGIICDKKKKSIFIEDKLIRYRRHMENVTEMSHYPLKKMVRNRLCLILRLISLKK